MLDTGSRRLPSQHIVLSTLLFELYASSLSLLGGNDRPESGQYAEMNVNYRKFFADHSRGLHFPTAVSILTSHKCYKAARTVDVFWQATISELASFARCTPTQTIRLLSCIYLDSNGIMRMLLS
jgi:hypothetical protein